MMRITVFIVAVGFVIGCGKNPATQQNSPSQPNQPGVPPSENSPKQPAPKVEVRDLDPATLKTWTNEFDKDAKAMEKKYIGTRWRFKYRPLGSSIASNPTLLVGDIPDDTQFGWGANIEMVTADEAKVAYSKKEAVIEAELEELRPGQAVKSRFKNGKVVSNR